jgi:hypothetical protein
MEHHDTTNRPFFTNEEIPNNVFCPLQFSGNQITAVAILEWKRCSDAETIQFDDSEKGQALSYGQSILNAQTWRTFIVVCLANLDLLQCFLVTKLNGLIHLTEYAAVSFYDLGREILWRLVQTTRFCG